MEAVKSLFRWLLAAARYTAASMMTVLILIVMAKAIKVLLWPETLSLSVYQGNMFVRRFDGRQKPNKLQFSFAIMAVMPTSAARTYLSNTTAYIFGKDTPAASSSHPSDDCLILFRLHEIMVSQQQQEDTVFKVLNVSRNPNVVESSFFDILYDSSHHDIISDLTMRLDGTVVSEVSSTLSYNRTTTYYCWPLVVRLDQVAEVEQGYYSSKVLEDVYCREDQGKHLI